jgi:nucleotide-binding universal stress UspA family protein
MTPIIHKILMPTDFSASSERALEYAATLANSLGASVHLIHTLHDRGTSLPAWHPDAGYNARRRERHYRAEQARLTAIAQRLQATVPVVSAEVRTGDAASEIVKAAVDYGCDLVVMGTHGRTGLSHLVLGSVAEAVIRQAPCPVLAIRQSEAAAPVRRGRSVA